MAISKNPKKLKREIGLFVKQYKRTSRKCFDPNDRSYDRRIEKLIKNMDAEELFNIINDEEDEK
jgi:hypothetical protein